MLSAESAAVVRVTLPAVAGALDEITTRFYGAMFRDRPELLDGMFNRGNQAGGDQRRALAGSIAGFVTALPADPDARPDALPARIAHKHAAVGVTDDQYTIVHKYLFGAMAETLGDAVTPEVAAAWDEVYWPMADALIGREARLYQDAGAEPGRTWRQWRVVERHIETPDVVSFLLRPADGRPAPRARAGQYVSVRVLMPDGVHQLRQYSLSSDPGRELRRITVERVAGDPDGEVSNLLHDHVREGAELPLSAPFGDVFLDGPAAGTDPLVLVSAGIGCTPHEGDPGASRSGRLHPPRAGPARRPLPRRPRPVRRDPRACRGNCCTPVRSSGTSVPGPRSPTPAPVFQHDASGTRSSAPTCGCPAARPEPHCNLPGKDSR